MTASVTLYVAYFIKDEYPLEYTVTDSPELMLKKIIYRLAEGWTLKSLETQ